MHSPEAHSIKPEAAYERKRVTEILLQSTKTGVRKKIKELFNGNPELHFEKEEPGTVIFRLDNIIKLAKGTSLNEVKYWVEEAHRAALKEIAEQITSRYVLEKEEEEILIGEAGIKIDVRLKVLEPEMQTEVIEMMKKDLMPHDQGGDTEQFHIEEEYIEKMRSKLIPVSKKVAELLHVEEDLQEEIGSRYLILDEVRGGAMGKVYKALDLQLFGRIVALKVTNFFEQWGEGEMGSEERRMRFQREVQNQAKITHSNIAYAYHAKMGKTQGYESMEWVEGKTLQDLLGDANTVPLLPEGGSPGAIKMMMQILEALEVLHHQENPIVHRDIKPSNIILTPQGNIKIVDFGISSYEKSDELIKYGKKISRRPAPDRTTRNRGAVCSLPYAAPEYLALGDICTAYDIYSAGIIFYQLLTGDLPIKEDTARGIYERVTEWFRGSDSRIIPLKIINQAVPDKLGDLILSKMVTVTPEERGTAKEIYEELNVIRAELEKKGKMKYEEETKRYPDFQAPKEPQDDFDDIVID